jgi:hypothetical protein
MASSTWRALLPPGLLLLAAGVQIGLATGAELTPWLGGGFGMFSTTDSPGARHVHVFALTPGVERELSLMSVDREVLRRAGAFPIDMHLVALARAFASAPIPDGAGAARAIRVQVWRTRFDTRTLTPASELICQRDLETAADR